MPFGVYSSFNRDFGTDSSFKLYSKQTISNVVGAKFSGAVVPNFLYNVTTTKNTLSGVVADDDTGTNPVPFEVSIDPGNYDENTLAGLLTTAINTEISPLTISITFLQNQGKLSFQVSGGKYVQFLTDYNSTSGKNTGLNIMLGLPKKRDTEFGSPLVAERCMNLARYSEILLYCDILADTSFISATSNRAPLLTVIPMNVAFGDILYYEPKSNEEWQRTSTRDISTIAFWLTDKEGDPIDLNGGYITIKLEFLLG